MEDIIATTAVKIWEVHGTVNFKLQLLQIKRGTLSDWCASFVLFIQVLLIYAFFNSSILSRTSLVTLWTRWNLPATLAMTKVKITNTTTA